MLSCISQISYFVRKNRPEHNWYIYPNYCQWLPWALILKLAKPSLPKYFEKHCREFCLQESHLASELLLLKLWLLVIFNMNWMRNPILSVCPMTPWSVPAVTKFTRYWTMNRRVSTKKQTTILSVSTVRSHALTSGEFWINFVPFLPFK